MYDTITEIISALRGQPPDPIPALAAIEALKRRMHQQGHVRGVATPYAADAGPTPTLAELPELIHALCSWCRKHASDYDPHQEMYRYQAVEQRAQSAGPTVSGFVLSTPPTQAEWQAAGHMAGITLDHLALHLKTSLGSSGGVKIPDWEFAPGRFRFRGTWYDLTGQRLSLLEALVKARHLTLSNADIIRVCSPGTESERPYAYISELNKALRKLLNLRENPVKPIPPAGSYHLTTPS